MVKLNRDGTYDVFGYGVGEPLYNVTKEELDDLRLEIEGVRSEEVGEMDNCMCEIKEIVNRIKRELGR